MRICEVAGTWVRLLAPHVWSKMIPEIVSIKIDTSIISTAAKQETSLLR